MKRDAVKKGYKCIILVTDCSEKSLAANETALNLAREHSAKVIAVDTVRAPSFTAKWLNSNFEDLFDIVVADKRERLEKVANRLKESGIVVETRILIGKSSEEIARAAITENADLVVRYMKGIKSQQKSLFGTTARNLMRVCPAPLLLVSDKPIANPTVLTCINPEHEVNENEAILSEGQKLATSSQNIMALCCWKFFGGEFLSGYLDSKMQHKYLSEAEQNYRGLYQQFLEKHDLGAFGEKVYLENGDPIQVIPEFCEKNSVDVVVMSSASQNHPLKRLLGSTVESVLDSLPCSLLVVKPIGFTSPIKPQKKAEVVNS